MGGFGDFYNQTVLHPVGLAAVLILGAALVLLPRRFAVFPMIIVACSIPSAQRLVVMSLDFSLLRILVLFAWTRLFLRNEFRGFKWNRLDTLFAAWMVSGIVIYTFQQGTGSALINRLGWAFEGLGMYFFFRCVLQSFEDLDRLVLGFIIMSLPVAVAFLIEQRTGRNAFSIFGGVPQITVIREGRLRCQGAFAHAILAGCFWASIMPLMVAHLIHGRKWLSICGLACSALIVLMCASSTPVMSVLLVFIGVSFYLLRHQLRAVRWAFFGSLVVLHFAMNHPVWHLLARVDIVGGSTGYHRYSIMNATINNFSKWWMLGEANPLSWGNEDMSDITNQYILEALRGGLITLVAFIAGIAVAFGMLGKALRLLEDKSPRHFLVFCVGVSLFVHVVTYFGVSYFGQIIMLWYLNLAMIGSLPAMCSSFVGPNVSAEKKMISETLAVQDSQVKGSGGIVFVQFE